MVYELSDARDMTIQEPSGGGYIIFNRQIFNDPRYESLTSIQRDLLIHCIVNATYLPAADKYFGPIKVTTKRGQLAVTLSELQNELGKGVTRQNVRSALKRLEQLKYLTCNSTNKYTLVTVENYDFLVSCNEKPTHNSTQGQHTGNTQLTTKKPGSLGAVGLEGAGNKVIKVNKEINNIYTLVVDYLNEQAGTKYKSTASKTKKLIDARVNEKFTLDDFKMVIDKKVAEWIGTEYEQYLRPETLFGTKFESYLNQPVKNQAEHRQVKKVYE